MAKTKKDKKREAQIVAIELRLMDLAQGAAGGCAVEDGQDDGHGIAYSMGIPEWLRFVQAARRSFRENENNEAPAQTVAFELYNLEHFAERFDVAARHLYDLGVRA